MENIDTEEAIKIRGSVPLGNLISGRYRMSTRLSKGASTKIVPSSIDQHKLSIYVDI